MKFILFLLFLLYISTPLLAQMDKQNTNTLSIQSYLDFTKTNTQSATWLTYDLKKISLEARYNYDWENNVSLYAGLIKRVKDWKFRFLQGVTFGSTTGIAISPTVILDKSKLFIFNQTQYMIGVSKMPSYFLHWAEVYYKLTDAVWIGLTDRIYLDNTYKDIAFGPQILFTFKNVFVTFYWWVPTKQSESKAFLVAGYEHDFIRQ